MNTCHGVLLEAVSIQSYIFQSNTLKTNMGASHLIQHEIFDTHLKQAVSQVFGKSYDSSWEAWKSNPADIRISKEPFEIGYIGGGNALLLFQEEDTAKQVIKAWSRLLLVKTPGIVTAAAIRQFKTDDFKKSLDDLFKELKENKAKYIPQTVIPRHGITAECRQSGLSAEDWDKDEKKFISSVTGAKLNAAKPARDYFQDAFKSQLQDIYCFPNEFEKMGSLKGEDSHIAVVHIDGNRMAKRFQNANSLKAIRELSVSVNQATVKAFSELVSHVVDNYRTIMENDLDFKPSAYPKDEGKYCLPLTPIVLGGDDVTFVCDGKLGIYFAKQFIESFEKKTVSDKKKLTACAGIAIIKNKYPFYRGYELSGELCTSAKFLNGKEENPEKMISALDFHVSMSGIFGSLDHIRQNHFQAPEGNLLNRPYKLIPAHSGDEQSLDLMIELAGKLKHDFPRSKIKALQSVLSLSKPDHDKFVAETKFRDRSLPEMPGKVNYHETVFNEKTIYYDMIEITEFYPKHALEKGGKQ